MSDTRPYFLTILLHPQATTHEREAVEATVRSWVEEHSGTVTTVTADAKRRLAYPIAHLHQATYSALWFQLPPTDFSDLQEKLKRQKKVLRFTLLKAAPRTWGKTLKDVPLRPSGEPEKAAAPKKEKASIEKLDEKIEEILGEEVL